MTSDNRHSSRRAVKDDGNSNPKGGSEPEGLRRSTRERLGQKDLAVSSSIRKSDRSPNKPPPGEEGGAERKGVGPSPLRRSDRGKGSAASPESKNAGKSSPAKQRKGQKEKSVTQTSSESKEVTPGRRNLYSIPGYKALYKNRKLKSAGHIKKKQREGKLSQEDGNNSGGELDEVDESSSIGVERTLVIKELVKDKLGGNKVPSSRRSPNAMNKILNVEPEKKENEVTQGGASEDSGQEKMPSKRKKIMSEADADCPDANASKRVCTSNDEDAASGLRAELDSTGEGISTHNANLNPELASPSLNKDTEELEVPTSVGHVEKCINLLQHKGPPKSHLPVSEQFKCFTCKLGGTLLCCVGSGCKRSYHFSCLDPPIDELPVGVWYCLACVKKKLECGVHSVSEGVESIWDTKEVSVLDVDGMRNEREFFVKYIGLGHIHNRWIPESKLLLDAPALISKFDRESQVINWKQEWTIPHRLLQKRLLISPKQRDLLVTQHVGIKLDSHYEWLVKWCGLGYDNATWELDNASLFKSPDGQALIKDYESRHKRASSTVDKIPMSENSKSDKLSELRPGTSTGIESNFQDFTDKLHEFWRKGQNAVVIEELENERIMKTISLVQSFQPNNCQPFLIMSSSATLHSWDNKFLKSAPHINVVVYNGNKDLRKLIRKLEFYMEGGVIMFQVLVTTFEIALEDLDILRRIKWELLIIDEPQRTRISSNCTQIKQLDARRRLLLLSCQLKENVAEYNNLLCLLESPKDSPNSNSLLTGSGDNVVNLKEKLSRYIVHQRKPDSSRFREYWVPLQIANLQLEQYCATLISNTAILCAPNKITSDGSLRDVLVSSRKCCDHPYIVDTSTPERLSKGIPQSEYLNFGINASGKFQFLDRMLSEMKKNGLRALILFQDFGKDSIGGFLDDLLRQRFGTDSFDIIRVGIPRNVKNASMSNFNEDSNRFVFLLETRACHSSIRLSSIDTVIIFGSDWNPMSDMRALQKLTLDPPSKQIPIFRLYVSHTLEEKALSLAAKQEKNLDTLQNIGWNTSHLLLMWGASQQFRSLDEFHRDTIMDPRANPSLEDAVQETIQIISSNCEGAESSSSSSFSSVQIVGGAYRCESSLPGELQCKVTDEAEPHNFWAKLLEGKQPPWKYISGFTQRNRKKVQYFDKEAVIEEAVKKRRRLVNNLDSPSSEPESVAVSTPRFTTPQLREGNESIRANSAPASPLYNNILELLPNKFFETEERRKLREEQKSLHLSMKPGISRLCKILHITGESEDLVREFLEYMMTYHNVSSDSLTMKQAFQISLIWTVASLLDLKIDHQQSVDLARKHLSFSCRKDEVEFAYSMVGCFKTIFAYRTGKLEAVSSHGLSSYAKSDVMHCVNRIQKKYQKKLQKLIQKQEEEKEKIMQRYEEDKSKIQERLKLESLVIRACCEENTLMRRDKLRLVEISSAKELEELENKKNASLKNLESEELATRETLREKEACWLAAVKSWVCPELFGKKLGNKPFNFSELLQTNEGRLNNGVEKNPVSVDPPPPEDQTRNDLTTNVPENEVQSEAQQIVPPTEGVQNLVPGDGPSSGDRDPDTITETMPVNETQPEVVSSAVGEVNGCSSTQLPSEEQQLPDTASITEPSGEVPSSVPEPSHPEVEAIHTGEANGEIPPVASSGSISLDRQENPNNAVDQNSVPQELCQTNFTSAPPETELNNVDPVPPSNQAPEDALAGDQQNASEAAERPVSQPVDTSEPNERANEATVSEPASQVGVSPSSNPLSKDNSVGVPLSEETPRREIRASNQVSNLPNLLPRTASSLPSNGFPSGSRNTSFPIAPEFNNHSAPQVFAWVPPLPNADPLQKELERLSAEFEGIRKNHEDTKLKLKSDLEKEIEEINRKYAIKQQETDSNFLTKKKVYDDRQSTVLLNKILAEAFRTKCMEVRSSSSSRSGTHQHDANGSSGHQMAHHRHHQQPMQQNPSRLVLRIPGSATTANRNAPPHPIPATVAFPSSVPPAIPTAARNTPTPPPPPPPPPPPVMPVVRPSTAAASPTPPLVGSISFSNATPQGGGTQTSSRPPHLRSSSPHQRGGGGIPPRPPNLASPASTAVAPALPPQRPDPAGPARHETSRDLPNIANLASVLEARRNQPPQAQSVIGLHLVSDFLSGPDRFRGAASGPPLAAAAAEADVVCLSDDD